MFDKSKLITVPVDQWINEWMERESAPEYRGCMVVQLYTIRKKHGREACKGYRNYIKETGRYPTQKQR
jgi:hypothetical protein